MADRVGVIMRGGEMLMVEQKSELIRRLGNKRLKIRIESPLASVPADLAGLDLVLGPDGRDLIHTYHARGQATGIHDLLGRLMASGIRIEDVETVESSLEEIFVNLVGRRS